MPADIDRLVAAFVQADGRQKAALELVSSLAGVKWEAVAGLREAGLTYREIGDAVGMSVPGVQRIAYKTGRKDRE